MKTFAGRFRSPRYQGQATSRGGADNSELSAHTLELSCFFVEDFVRESVRHVKSALAGDSIKPVVSVAEPQESLT